MSLRITVDVFSGRPNPVIELDGRETDEALARLRTADEASPPVESRLGYRGLIVEQIGAKPSNRLPKMFRVAGGAL
ncbi:MAG TPA: hypothetical protein VHR66_04460 [Gemmataceae bacterium]|jgi:hypothetical protein|nr:hypothetical protein [Gemmataceae bacterium]